MQFTYSGGATAGNYVSSAHVTRTGRMKDGKFTKTAIITLHDMGLNGFTNYATLFGCHEMEPISNAFTVFHVDFPCMKSPKLVNKNSSNYDDKENASPSGVESKSASVSGQWDPNLEYPSLDELAKAMLPAVMEFFSLSSVIIMGTGVGANVGIRYALAQPDKVMGLITLNPVFYQIGWHEWFNYRVFLQKCRENGRKWLKWLKKIKIHLFRPKMTQNDLKFHVLTQKRPKITFFDPNITPK